MLRLHSLVYRAPEMTIVREGVRSLATPGKAIDNYVSVLTPQLRPVITKSVMNFIPKSVDPKLHWALKFYERRLRFGEPELGKMNHDGLF